MIYMADAQSESNQEEDPRFHLMAPNAGDLLATHMNHNRSWCEMLSELHTPSLMRKPYNDRLNCKP